MNNRSKHILASVAGFLLLVLTLGLVFCDVVGMCFCGAGSSGTHRETGWFAH